MNIGWLGGSFDPVHVGHVQLAEAALKQLKLDKVYLVLSPRSPFKKNKMRAHLKHRMAMLKLAVKGHKNIVPGLFELSRRGVTYTVSSLRRYHAQFPTHQLFFILGSDAWAGFDKWKQPKKIQEYAHMVVGLRPGTRVKLFKQFSEPLLLKGRFPNVSSTELRERKKTKQINPQVLKYIRDHHLYDACTSH